MALILPFIESEIQDQYLADDNNRPWIVGFSGGKDSTMLLQLVWKAVQKLPEELRHRPVYVVCNDTMVENPRIVRFIEETLHRIEAAATSQSMPFVVQRTIPRLEDSFWTNLLGKGYPAPSSTFRWCTERLKISPTTQFIKTKISDSGEVIILLGTRSAESSRRSRSMAKHAVHGQRLRKHVLPNAYVYAPIKDIETNELWQYLSQVPPPWGGTHKELITLYRNASTEADCPLVIDDETPSCGKSRFGCWVCTVVVKDKSMDGLIMNGESWMEPLSELRDFLIEARDNPETYRQKHLRNGTIREGFWGPYLPSTRADILRQLLEAQKVIRDEYDPTMTFITHQELVAIQVIWYRDGIFNHNVADIYNTVFGTQLDMSKHTIKIREEETWLREVCKDNLDHFDLIQNAVKIIKTKSLMQRKRGLQNDIENLLNDYLKSQQPTETGEIQALIATASLADS
jgi:DNA sulfur modification protein DndC